MNMIIEGIENDRIVELKAEYIDSEYNQVNTDEIKYNTIAANCEDWQPGSGTRLHLVDKNNAEFPNLVHCEWSIIAHENPVYNCIAYSADIPTKFLNPWNIDNDYGDGDGLFELENMDMFYKDKLDLYPLAANAEEAEVIYYGYQIDSWGYGEYYDKLLQGIIDMSLVPRPGYHAAGKVTCDCATCTNMKKKFTMYRSKLGVGYLIEHVWNQLNNDEIIGYGEPTRFYRKKKAGE